MLLYTCPARTIAGSAPLVQHPCGKAANALDNAGYTYDTEVVGGFKSLGFTRRGKRDKIRELTGQDDVPVLVLDDGQVVAGSKEIVAWAERNPA
jgi:glutaredoxin